jgi:hypothetical protein
MITKTYRIEDIIFTELSPKKGSIEYFLIDSVKEKRKVTGIAKLGFNGKIKSVRPVYLREKPLIDVLVQSDVGERITVDFTEFNKTPRDKLKARKLSVTKGIPATKVQGDISATMVYQEAYDDMLYAQKLRSFLPDLSKVGVWLVFLFIIWMAFMAVNQFAGLLK